MPERRRVAIVPAHNEEEAIGGVVDELRAFDPELDVVVIDDGSTDATAAARRRRRRRRRQPAVQPRHRRRRPDRLQVRARARLRPRVRLDGDGQHDPQQIPNLLAPLARGEADIVVGSRFAERRRRLPAAVRPPRRDPLVRAARLAADAPEADRHDVRLPGAEPPGDRALRRRLPARLPRGRGGRDGRPAPAADPRGAGRRCASARPARSSITALRSLYYAIKVTLALFVGIFRRRIVPLEEREMDP